MGRDEMVSAGLPAEFARRQLSVALDPLSVHTLSSPSTPVSSCPRGPAGQCNDEQLVSRLAFGELIRLLVREHEDVLEELAVVREEIALCGRSASCALLPSSAQTSSDRWQRFAQETVDDTSCSIAASEPLGADLQLATASIENREECERHTAHLNNLWHLTEENEQFADYSISFRRNHGLNLGMRAQSNLSTVASYITYASRFIMPPNSHPVLAWQVLGAFLIVYDLMLIPLGVFGIPTNVCTTSMDFITMFFWTLNLGVSLFIGYFEDGTLVTDPKTIARHYLQGWFFVDLATVVPDWLFYFMGDVTGDVVGLIRMVRLIKIWRLSRAMKLRILMDMLHDLVKSERLNILISILQMLAVLLMVNHFVACIWFMVSNTQGQMSWIDVYGFRDVDWGHQYVVAFHWGITQFTPSSMHVQPQNVPERVASICIVVFALVGFSYIVGSISGSLAQLRNLKADADRQFWNVKMYLTKQQVPTELATRIKRHLEHAFERQQKSSSVKEVRMFSLLSSGLLAELHCHNYLTRMGCHPLFCHLEKLSKVTAQRLASEAVEERYYAQCDHIFNSTELATHMWFLGGGLIRYSRSAQVMEIDPHTNAWISELVLWIDSWTHVGHLTAVTPCNMILLSPRSFGDVMRRNPEAYSLALTYANNFIRWWAMMSTSSSDVVLGSEVHSIFCGFLEVCSGVSGARH